MSNLIQIKRSTANATVTGLANGELAYTQASNTLWIGLPDGSGVAAIAGVRNPGTLTANQALVANSTSAINKVIVANLVPTVLWANGAAGNNSTFLSANSTGGVYWEVTSSITTNAAAQYTWTNTQTFDTNTATTRLKLNPTGEMCAITKDSIWYSTNLENWQKFSVPGYQWRSIEWFDNKWIAGAESSLTQYTFYTSTDGITWIPDNNGIQMMNFVTRT